MNLRAIRATSTMDFFVINSEFTLLLNIIKNINNNVKYKIDTQGLDSEKT